MAIKRPISQFGFYAVLTILALIIYSPNVGALPITKNIVPNPIASGIMALPERAYAERQQLSPIRVDGVIQELACENNLCRVKMLVKAVKRNTSPRPLAAGDIIAVINIPVAESKNDSMPPTTHQAPLIGLPDFSVHIPQPCSQTEAWLRPAEPSSDRNEVNNFELMAGPFGFGPSLED